ncbi:hypothetical protein CANARDRAFT_175255 [[Candida] arabinofermentans NRRL YB-2248]|uniref:Major facilitator superfamily (MFS) profile domain-containing protein n=1 Tax=[Candida] arabinofermentans NRRL YB-2248 TaxID=983967 RepID=A0A1E4T3M4_9ASCO|nr:hypothetical protein CANARDRAFT_175255 [[Candida] arabinofermentans NRRL YB-2248]
MNSVFDEHEEMPDNGIELTSQQPNSRKSNSVTHITKLRTDPEANHSDESHSRSNSEEEEEIDYPDGGLTAYTVLFGSFLGFTVDFGLVNSVGAVQSYLNQHQLAGVSSSLSSLIFSVFIAVSYISGIFSGVLFDEFGCKIPLMSGTILLFIGLFFTGECESVTAFVLVFGIVAGSACGLLMSPCGGLVTHYFMKKRAMCFAIATLGGSVGGILFPLLLSHLYTTVGFKWALRILSFVCTGLLLISFVLSKERLRPESSVIYSELPFGERCKVIFKNLYILSKKSIDFHALKDPKFFFCTLAAAFSELSLVCAITYYASFIVFLGYTETQANTMLTIMSAAGMFGRFFPGVLADRKLGPYNVMVVMIFFVGLSDLALWLGWCTNSKSLGSLYAFAIIYGFFSASVLSMTPACCSAISPTRDFGKRYATLSMVSGFFFLGGLTIGGVIIGHESTQSYKNFIVYSGVLALVGDFFWVVARYCIVGTKFNVKV